MIQPDVETPEYSVVVPVYQSSRSLFELVDRLRRVFDLSLSSTFEIILVDDGSTSEETWPTCQRLAHEEPRVIAIRLMRNYGKPGAVLCGLSHARGRWIVTIDDDLQQRPEDIPALAEYREHDVVVADFRGRRHGWLTVLLSRIKGRFDKIILGLPCKMSPLKLFKAEVAQGMLRIRTPYPFIPALMAHTTKDFKAVPVQHEASRHGKSRFTLGRRFRQFSNLLINNSSLLLRWFGGLGFLVACGGFLFALWVLLRKLVGWAPILPGWASLVVINLVFGGLILVALAIVGEYLIRILEGISEKPPYLVRDIIRETPPTAANTSMKTRPNNATTTALS